MKKILVINPGSTSTKYKLFDIKGNMLEEHNFKLKSTTKEQLFLDALDGITKIAIRVVHGGDISETTKITKTIKKKITFYLDFAPVHNKRALQVIEKMEQQFPGVNQYACFDTSFHQSIAAEFFTYPINQVLAKKYHLRKYGFHGLAIESALQKLKKLKKTEQKVLPKKIIFAHLGGGCSVTAVKNGKSFCTSMELTPLSGIMMTTRSGSVDPDIVNILVEKTGKDSRDISQILNNKSGFFGLTGSVDTLKIFSAAQKGSRKEKLAFDIFVNNIIEKIYAYAGLMGGLDAIVFSGGIGYGNAFLRKSITKKMNILKIHSSNIYAIDVDEELLMFNKIKKQS